MTPPSGPPVTSNPFYRRDPGGHRVAWSSVGVSVLIHVLVLGVAAFGVTRPLPANDPVMRPIRPLREVVEIVMVLDMPVLPEEPEDDDEEEEEEALRALPQVNVNPQGVVVESPNLGRETGIEITLPRVTGPGSLGETPAERLQPALRDGRIWAPLPPEALELTPEQREELLIAGRLGAWNDSIAAVAAAAAAWRDWTVTDGDGDRWGVADGRLYLGDFAIPFPMTFSGSSADREYLRDFAEMQRQGQTAVIQQSVRERMEAIRARRDRERAEAQATADSAGPNPR